nr:signal peptidase I [uncultured Sphingomonas sp.]
MATIPPAPETTDGVAPETTDAPEKKKDSFLRSLLYFVVAAWLLRSLVVASFSIPSGSMQPTMQIGDYLFVSKWPYGYSSASFPFHFPSFDGRIFGSDPKRGDIVVFVGPQGEDVVKRVIGLPGDLVTVQDGQPVINGVPVARQHIPDVNLIKSANTTCRRVTPSGAMDENSSVPTGGPCKYTAYRETLPNGVSYTTLDQVDQPSDHFGPILVPQGAVFLMGDNRDDSADSRYPVDVGGMGFVPIDHIVGRAQFVFWSTDGSASWINPISWFTALRTDRLGTDFHP